MNVLFLTDLFMPHAGGARIYYYNLYKNMVALFPDRVRVLTKTTPGWTEFDRQESTGSLRIVRRGRPMPNWKYYQLPRITGPLIQAVRQVRSCKPDLVHFGDLCPPGIVSLGLKSMFGLRYLAYCHGDENAQVDGRRFQPRVRDRIYREASAVVAANEFARQGLIRIGIPESRIHKITPGVDAERFRPYPPNPKLVEQFSLSGRKVLFTAARLVPKKGHATVLRAVARMRRNIPTLRYLIAGEGPERSKLELLTRELGISEMVTFLGNISNERLPEFYNLCDVFVMANRQDTGGDIETFGMVFIEANAAGKAVIAGRSGGAAEAVVDGSTGLIVDPENVDELADALTTLLINNDLRQKLGSNGLRRVQFDFNWRSRAEALRRISEEILGWPSGENCKERVSSMLDQRL